MRVMTWNIHGCVGTDGRRDPARIAAGIAAMRPDILALQEVDVDRVHADAADLLDRFGACLGGHRAECYTIEAEGRRYGTVLYARWPIRDARVHDLAVAGREPRRAVEATVETPHGPVRVVGTHFGLSRRERGDQIARLRRAVGRPVDRPTILLGDFNDWQGPGAVGRRFGADFDAVVAPRSFPARFPLFPLDRIFVSRHFSIAALPSVIPAVASDHRAVAATVAWRPHED